MTNWKADPKVKEAIETLQAAIARCTADFVDGRIVQKIGELCAAVASSGSPPSPEHPLDGRESCQQYTEHWLRWRGEAVESEECARDLAADYDLYLGALEYEATEGASSGSPPSPFPDSSYEIPLERRLEAATMDFHHPRLGIHSTGHHTIPLTTKEGQRLLALLRASSGSTGAPRDQPTPESGATDFKAHVIEVLGDVMGELRIARDSSQGSMVEQIANELRRLHTENAGIWKARESLLSENARLQGAGSTGDRLEGAPSTRRLLDQSVDGAGSTGAPDDAWAGLDAQAVAELESFREHLEHHKEASPARVCRFCEEKWPSSTVVQPAGSTGAPSAQPTPETKT